MSNDQLINGQWVTGLGDSFTSVNPIDDAVVWQGASANSDQVNQAVLSAQQVQSQWFGLGFDKRVYILEKYVEHLSNNADEMAKLISEETSKPLWESKTEVAAMKNKLAISIEAYHQRTGSKVTVLPSSSQQLTHRPHGVLAVLGPYNFPGHLPNGHILPALLAGNTVVFKPSEQTPAVAQFMVNLLQQAGVPDGVINLVQGNGFIGQQLIESSVNGVLFTGSYLTGQKIHRYFAGRPEVLLALEMGGNNPLILGSEIDVSSAVYQTVMSAFITAGQRCTCARRLMVPATQQGDDFLSELVSVTQTIKVGHPSEQPEPFMGGVINLATAKHLMKSQAILVSSGAEALLEMSYKNDQPTALLTPGIIQLTSEQAGSQDEELFGPLLQVIRTHSIDESIAIANQTQYGLSAGLLSNNQQEQQLFYQNIRAGIVNINNQLTGAASNAPFGGIGASGNQRPSAFYAADYCAYPMASLVSDVMWAPEVYPEGFSDV